jgi:hypothetical protein
LFLLSFPSQTDEAFRSLERIAESTGVVCFA